ncbi:hypothetical protein [Magnetovibrio blakemorei]|uniref:hypothetical protein n=1 Tax=Magnetovibrio blakemorei TaxID=28181 RepID=UPI001112DB13|nr:hypothetical protein [Magnetovibrio blakemorei]
MNNITRRWLVSVEMGWIDDVDLKSLIPPEMLIYNPWEDGKVGNGHVWAFGEIQATYDSCWHTNLVFECSRIELDVFLRRFSDHVRSVCGPDSRLLDDPSIFEEMEKQFYPCPPHPVVAMDQHVKFVSFLREKCDLVFPAGDRFVR